MLQRKLRIPNSQKDLESSSDNKSTEQESPKPILKKQKQIQNKNSSLDNLKWSLQNLNLYHLKNSKKLQESLKQNENSNKRTHNYKFLNNKNNRYAKSLQTHSQHISPIYIQYRNDQKRKTMSNIRNNGEREEKQQQQYPFIQTSRSQQPKKTYNSIYPQMLEKQWDSDRNTKKSIDFDLQQNNNFPKSKFQTQQKFHKIKNNNNNILEGIDLQLPKTQQTNREQIEKNKQKLAKKIRDYSRKEDELKLSLRLFNSSNFNKSVFNLKKETSQQEENQCSIRNIVSSNMQVINPNLAVQNQGKNIQGLRKSLSKDLSKQKNYIQQQKQQEFSIFNKDKQQSIIKQQQQRELQQQELDKKNNYYELPNNKNFQIDHLIIHSDRYIQEKNPQDNEIYYNIKSTKNNKKSLIKKLTHKKYNFSKHNRVCFLSDLAKDAKFLSKSQPDILSEVVSQKQQKQSQFINSNNNSPNFLPQNEYNNNIINQQSITHSTMPFSPEKIMNENNDSPNIKHRNNIFHIKSKSGNLQQLHCLDTEINFQPRSQFKSQTQKYDQQYKSLNKNPSLNPEVYEQQQQQQNFGIFYDKIENKTIRDIQDIKIRNSDPQFRIDKKPQRSKAKKISVQSQYNQLQQIYVQKMEEMKEKQKQEKIKYQQDIEKVFNKNKNIQQQQSPFEAIETIQGPVETNNDFTDNMSLLEEF